MQGAVDAALPDGFLRGLIIEGILGGVGSRIVFLPQILILFLFILLLEASGYMTRAAFLMDGIMAKVGLSGRGSFRCCPALPAPFPASWRRARFRCQDRLTTILIAPLMTCSARLPVYTLIIGAFIPSTNVGGSPVGLQGLVLFGLYLSGIVGALVVALVLRRTVAKGNAAGFMMEMPRYQWPRLRDVAIGLWQRAWIFLRRAGTIIFVTTIALWLLLSYPRCRRAAAKARSITASPGASRAGWRSSSNRSVQPRHRAALIPAMAARRSRVGTRHRQCDRGGRRRGSDGAIAQRTLAGPLEHRDALAFLAWFVFAPQCISTIAITRETNGWRWPFFMVGYCSCSPMPLLNHLLDSRCLWTRLILPTFCGAERHGWQRQQGNSIGNLGADPKSSRFRMAARSPTSASRPANSGRTA